ncbi:hypothetical protein N658DRAFT_528045 [Parathielavia hyrcaniae]|uniref:Rhodopsin domain-containing protein n=1 Tax=Parathielavia hyrcaniae TaxID=113614 RepID=A0AAN6PQB8_9PEZI|nr:hypothetical protein N658DRAFT_528045 [Parathielavia hyrcaniae]
MSNTSGDQETKGPLILGVIVTMTAIAFFFVLARIYSRLISIARLGADDYLLILSILLIIVYVGLDGVAISHGAGRHIETLSEEEIAAALYYAIIAVVPGILSFTLPKFAVVILLVQVLNPGRWHRAFLWIISIVYLLLSVGGIILTFVQCTPAASQWGAVEGTCWDPRIVFSYAVTHGICSVLFDFYLAVYPTIVICRLILNWKKKLALSSALGFGYCAAAISAYKCYTLRGILNVHDLTYAVDDIILWTNIEANCVIIGACIPCLYPLVKKLWGTAALETKKRSTQGRSDGSNTVITIGGSAVKPKKRARQPPRLPIDITHDDNDQYGLQVLHKDSVHTSTTELWDEEIDVVRVRIGRL